MMSKQDQIDRIKKTERKALRLLKESSDPKRKSKNPQGALINKMLEDVIKWEALYLKRYGRDISGV